MDCVEGRKLKIRLHSVCFISIKGVVDSLCSKVAVTGLISIRLSTLNDNVRGAACCLSHSVSAPSPFTNLTPLLGWTSKVTSVWK